MIKTQLLITQIQKKKKNRSLKILLWKGYVEKKLIKFQLVSNVNFFSLLRLYFFFFLCLKHLTFFLNLKYIIIFSPDTH